jgi:PAS domain S-box-containing protein
MDEGRKQQLGPVAIREYEARLRAVMEAGSEGILISQDSVVVAVSEALLATSGCTRDEFIGRAVTDFVVEEFRDLVRQREAAGDEGRFDAVALFKGGRRVPVEVVTRTDLIRGRRSPMTTLRDVTEKRRLAEQLRHAQRMKAVGMLAGGLAHDLNNLLTIIQSYGEILVQELQEPLRSDAREMRKAARAAGALIGQLLAYTPQQSAHRNASDVNAVVRDCERLLRDLVGGQITITLDLAPDAGQVNLASPQLQQVIISLALNARDALPDGGSIGIKTRSVEVSEAQARAHIAAHPGRHVMLAVSDSGTGKAADVKAPGLALVDAIVRLGGGFIALEAAAAVGSTFTIYLPAAARG